MDAPQTTSKLQHALTFVLITILIDSIGLGIIIPVMPQLITQLSGGELSAGAKEGGWLAASYAITQFFFAPLMGSLSDRYGRRPILLGSLLGLGIDYVFLAFAPTLGWLVVGRVIAGITGASFSTAQAYIADITTPEKRSQRFGMIGAAFGVGFILGPLIGGVASQYGLRVPFLVAAGLSLLNFLYGFFVIPESLAKENRRSFSWARANPFGSLLHLSKYAGVVPLILAMGLLYIAGHANQSASSYVGMERYNWGPKEIGYFLTYVGVLIAFAQGFLVQVVIKKLGQLRTAYFGFFWYVIGCVMLGFAEQEWMFYAFFVVQALGFVSGAALQGYMSAQVPANEQGELQGATGSVMSLTGIIGPLLMLNLFSFYTAKEAPLYIPGIPYFAAAALTFTAALIFLSIQRNLRLKAEAGIK
jgi:DHA1 family tetracycline resistance protein-like MFS transporter